MKKILFAVLLLCLPAASAAHAGEEEETIEVTATGIGVDADAATKSALKSAVESALGTLIDSKTIIENDEVIEDKILSHSGGYVEKHTIIEGPTASEGMVTVKIEASVKRVQLVSQLETQNILISQKIDGLSMGGEVFTKREDKAAAEDMLREIMKGFPENYIKIELNGKPEVDSTGKKVIVKVKNSVDREKYSAFLSRLDTFLEQAAIRKRRNIRTKLTPIAIDGYACLKMENFKMHSVGEDVTDSPIAVLLTRVSDDNTLAMWKSYNITSEMNAIIYKVRDSRPSLQIEVIDSSGDAIETKKLDLSYPYSRLKQYDSHYTAWYFYPYFNNFGTFADFGPIDGVMNTIVEFDTLFPDEISDIREIKLSLKKP